MAPLCLLFASTLGDCQNQKEMLENTQNTPLKKKKKTLAAQKNLFPQSQIEPVAPAVKTQSLNHWTVTEVLSLYLHLCISLNLLPFSAVKLGCCSSRQSLKVFSCFAVKEAIRVHCTIIHKKSGRMWEESL